MVISGKSITVVGLSSRPLLNFSLLPNVQNLFIFSSFFSWNTANIGDFHRGSRKTDQNKKNNDDGPTVVTNEERRLAELKKWPKIVQVPVGGDFWWESTPSMGIFLRDECRKSIVVFRKETINRRNGERMGNEEIIQPSNNVQTGATTRR
ncbi:hypothetical protein GWI33_013860 [Rhynchophorus ferrugineus]|uniref:Uncharacterized protein n=1 Tax=Rhynchophorus ferrugineus TaxID=354439 RepID=A0A834M688_RHYFE|nr:hypothetical protein GWI33_013860 [Rhynchophorus ferrugineus]